MNMKTRIAKLKLITDNSAIISPYDQYRSHLMFARDMYQAILRCELKGTPTTYVFPYKMKFGNKIFTWNDEKEEWYIQEEVDPDYWFKKHNMTPPYDKPVACYEIYSLGSAVRAKYGS